MTQLECHDFVVVRNSRYLFTPTISSWKIACTISHLQPLNTHKMQKKTDYVWNVRNNRNGIWNIKKSGHSFPFYLLKKSETIRDTIEIVTYIADIKVTLQSFCKRILYMYQIVYVLLIFKAIMVKKLYIRNRGLTMLRSLVQLCFMGLVE